MKKMLLIAGAAMLVACGQTGVSSEWTDMSGSFDGWNQIGDANWRIEDGEFVADSGNGHLVTKKHFDDVQIQLEFWVDVPANSGVFMRASDPSEITQSNSYEVNIFDTREDQTYRTGGVVEFAAPDYVINTGNKWNTYDITIQGDELKVVLNGVTTVELEDDTYDSGPISLQYGAGVVKFRNVRIREL